MAEDVHGAAESLGGGVVAGIGLPLASYWLAGPGQPWGSFVWLGCLIGGACLLAVPGYRMWGWGVLLGAAGLAIAFLIWLSASGLTLS